MLQPEIPAGRGAAQLLPAMRDFTLDNAAD
jgi:hypothetical protein